MSNKYFTVYAVTTTKQAEKLDITNQFPKINAQHILSERGQTLHGWDDIEIKLTDLAVDEFVALLGKGCQHKTKASLRRSIEHAFNGCESCGILERLTLNNGDGWDYTAGQSYTEELALVRKILK